jgi:hypothetical protein
MKVNGQLFTPARLAPGEGSYPHPLNRRPGGPQSHSGRCREVKEFLAPVGNRTPAAQLRNRRYTRSAIPIKVK